MASWETYDNHWDEQQGRDFVLKQPSIVGPWVVLGLGVTLVAFLGYLLYVNMLLPPAVVASSERIAHATTDVMSPPGQTKRQGQRAAGRHKAAVTIVPQGRAPNALLGGEGPALPPTSGATPGPQMLPLSRTTP